RKLTNDVITFYRHHRAMRALKTSGLLEIEPVLRPSAATESRRILQFSAKTCKKTTEKTGFSRPVLLKRVKSGGWCQSLIGAPSFQDCPEQHGAVQASRNELGGGNEVRFGLLLACPLECGSLRFSCFVAVKRAQSPFRAFRGSRASSGATESLL